MQLAAIKNEGKMRGKRGNTYSLLFLKKQLLPSLLQSQSQRLPLNFDLHQSPLQRHGNLWGRGVDDEVYVCHGALDLVVPTLELAGMGLGHSNDVITKCYSW